MYFPFLVESLTQKISVVPENEYSEIYKNKIFNDKFVENLKEKYENQGYLFILPIREDGSLGRWRWGYKKALEACKSNLFFVRSKESPTIYAKDYAKDTFLPKSLWFDIRYDASTKGTNILKDILPRNDFDYPKSIFAVEDFVFMGASKNGLILDFFAGSGTTAHAVITLNRKDSGTRKYIAIEQGNYFKTVLKSRLQKIVFSDTWKKGKPNTPHTGISHAFKMIKLESYEDTLNNLKLQRDPAQNDLLSALSPAAQEDYLLHYMLEIESRASLLSVTHFDHPFNYRLNIATDSAGASKPKTIDLVETFNYLIGLRVQHIDAQLAQGFVSVSGHLPNGQKTLVLWRDVDKIGYEALQRLCDKLAINPADSEYEVVYINGDHNIPSSITSTESEGNITKTLKIRQIEAEFLAQMFAIDGG
jgi:adenine-specific DNA-methyltransferase